MGNLERLKNQLNGQPPRKRGRGSGGPLSRENKRRKIQQEVRVIWEQHKLEMWHTHGVDLQDSPFAMLMHYLMVKGVL